MRRTKDIDVRHQAYGRAIAEDVKNVAGAVAGLEGLRARVRGAALLEGA